TGRGIGLAALTGASCLGSSPMKRTSSRILNGVSPEDVPPGLGRGRGTILECADRKEEPMQIEITYCVV
ncbi:MAG: hypothetical protein KBB14_16675, partial [Thermoanaerobaculia bacterium]|nr:hypothetical protein [Thermoanaerobaculia bacterium]